MSTGLSFDEEQARRLEMVYLTPDAVRRRRRVLDSLALQPGERVADIGCGPGFVALEMSEIVGDDGQIVGIDRSGAMLSLARKRCEGCARVELREGDATALPAADGEFDVAVSVQVYEFVSDVERAVGEMFRILRPGGRAAIVATDWDSILWHSSDEERMRRVLSAWDEHLADPGLPRKLQPMLRRAGFAIDGVSVINQLNAAYNEDTLSVGLIPLIQAFVGGRQGVTVDDAAAWAAELQALGAGGEYFFCLNQYLFTLMKPTG